MRISPNNTVSKLLLNARGRAAAVPVAVSRCSQTREAAANAAQETYLHDHFGRLLVKRQREGKRHSHSPNTARTECTGHGPLRARGRASLTKGFCVMSIVIAYLLADIFGSQGRSLILGACRSRATTSGRVLWPLVVNAVSMGQSVVIALAARDPAANLLGTVESHGDIHPDSSSGNPALR